MTALAVCLSAASVSARGIIRDAEIEATLKRIAKPLITAAGLNPNAIRIVVINNPEMNAFVAGRETIFLHTGLLTRLKTVGMIQAVIAHELAHIRAGHVISRGAAAEGAKSAAALGLLLAAMAARSGQGEAAGVIAAGTSRAAQRLFLAHTRGEETAADQASVRILARAGVSPQAALDALSLFSGQDLLSDRRRDPYARTHPLNSQRIASLRQSVATTRVVGDGKTSPTLAYWHARMVAKFEGFLRKPSRILTRAKAEPNVEIATYMRAIAYHRQSDMANAHAQLDRLIAHRPSDPYYAELKGQFYLEAGKAADALTWYRRAHQAAPKDGQIRAGLGRALLALDTNAATKEAVAHLERVWTAQVADPRTLAHLAIGYARLGQNGRASLATAERYALSGRIADAGIHANRAMGLLPEGTPAWRRANDIAIVARRAKR